MSMNLSSFQFRDETEELNAETRKDAPGKFVELPNGFTHYDLAGSRAGRLVILVHGFSIPYYIWDPTFHALADAGLHIIRYDLFGRGFSGRPDEIYRTRKANAKAMDWRIRTQPLRKYGASVTVDKGF